jgi:hypothetical protein
MRFNKWKLTAIANFLDPVDSQCERDRHNNTKPTVSSGVTEFSSKQFDSFLDIDHTDIETECFGCHVGYKPREITKVEDRHQKMEYGGPSVI